MPTPHQVRTLIDSLPQVGKIVHLAMRYDLQQEQDIQDELFTTRKEEYEETLTELVTAGGCDKPVELKRGPVLTALKRQSKADAESIRLTYNRDLAVAIIAIREENPRSNRYHYARRLETWETNRAAWKDLQIALNTRLTARQTALADFARFNKIEMTVEPMGNNPAAEARCQEALDRGRVPLSEAAPFPLHLNCVHWNGRAEMGPVDDCRKLWVGK